MKPILVMALVLASVSANAMNLSLDLCSGYDRSPVHFDITDKSLTMKTSDNTTTMNFVSTKAATDAELVEVSKELGAPVAEAVYGDLDAQSDADKTTSFQYLKLKDGQVAVIIAGIMSFSTSACKK